MMTNALKNSLVYYNDKSVKKSNDPNTPDYLYDLLNHYRQQIVPKGITRSKEKEQAQILENVLNNIKKFQIEYQKNNNYNIADMALEQSMSLLMQQLYNVNPKLFTELKLITHSKTNDSQGKVLENFMSDFITTVDAVYSSQSYNQMINYHHSGRLTDAVSTKIMLEQDMNNLMGEIYNNAVNTAEKNIFNLTSQANKNKYDENIEQNLTIKNMKTSNIGGRSIKIDNVGLDNVNIEITATSTMLDKVIEALSMATFTDKNLKNKFSFSFGNTKPNRVFMTVAEGSFRYKLYRYARMLNCMRTHYPDPHSMTPEYFYRIRQIYEITGGKQRIGNINNDLEERIAEIVAGTNKAKFLVVNKINSDKIKVIPTGDIVDACLNSFDNRIAIIGDPEEGDITVEKALDSRVNFNVKKFFIE